MGRHAERKHIPMTIADTLSKLTDKNLDKEEKAMKDALGKKVGEEVKEKIKVEEDKEKEAAQVNGNSTNKIPSSAVHPDRQNMVWRPSDARQPFTEKSLSPKRRSRRRSRERRKRRRKRDNSLSQSATPPPKNVLKKETGK